LKCQQTLLQILEFPSEETAEAVVYRLLQILLAAQVSFGCQHGNMAEKELNLFQLPAIDMAEFCAGSPKIVRSEMVQLHPLSAPPNNIPNDILGDPLTPRRSMANSSQRGSVRPFFVACLCNLSASDLGAFRIQASQKPRDGGLIFG
jgi:hypothetical protein